MLEKTPVLSANQAVILICYLRETGSTELVECLDKIIGKGIDTITPSEHVAAYSSFAQCSRAQVRPKIMQLLLKRISQNLDLLRMDELCHLAQLHQG